jgi:hypothetical protein
MIFTVDSEITHTHGGEHEDDTILVFWDGAPCSLVEVAEFQRCLLPPSLGRWTSTRLHGATSWRVIFTTDDGNMT